MCKGKDDYQGLFHTHPSGHIMPSISDITNIYNDGLGCIGSPKGNKIKCMVRKGSKEEDAFLEFHRAHMLFEIMGFGDLKEYDETIQKLSNKYFNDIDIK